MNQTGLARIEREIDRGSMRVDSMVYGSLGCVVPVVDGVLVMDTRNHELSVLKSELMLLSP